MTFSNARAISYSHRSGETPGEKKKEGRWKSSSGFSLRCEGERKLSDAGFTRHPPAGGETPVLAELLEEFHSSFRVGLLPPPKLDLQLYLLSLAQEVFRLGELPLQVRLPDL